MKSLRKVARSFGPLAWRDARISELEGRILALEGRLDYHRTRSRQRGREVEQLRRVVEQLNSENAAGAVLRRPSLLAQMSAWRRDLDRARRSGDTTDVRVGMNRKLAMYRFAESHGLRVPEIYGLWENPEDVDWAMLPDRIVLKSDGGSSGLGVLPLVRSQQGDQFRLVGAEGTKDPSHYVELLRDRLDRGMLRGPFFAEELMEDSRRPGTLPQDVKIYAFYGEVGHVLLRGMERHADTKSARWRYLTAEGEDLGQVNTTLKADATVPVPERLSAMVETARLLSRAVPLPFIRVDLYDLPDGVWFGELTLTPGGKQAYVEAHDKALGRLWEQASARLQRDLRLGRPADLEFGSHPIMTPSAADVQVGVSLEEELNALPEAQLVISPDEDPKDTEARYPA